MRSLTARLTAGLVIALFLLSVVFLGGLHYSLRHLAVTFITARLEHDLDNLLIGLSFDGRFQLRLDDSRLAQVFQQPYSGHYYEIQAGAQVLRSRSLWDADLKLPSETGSDSGQPFFLSGPNDQHLLALQRQFQRQGQSVSMVVTEDFDPIAEELRRLQLRIGLAALGVLGLLLLAQYLMVRGGLRPLRTIREEMQRLAAGEIRQLDPDAPREIRPLVAELNRLLGILEQRLERSRHALGNLAHALKTPLAVLTQAADPVPDAAGDELRRQADQIETLINRELKRARIAGAAAPGQRVRLAEVANDLIDTLAKIYRDKHLEIDCRMPPDSLFPGDRNDLMELLGNLLDNACRWSERRVRLSAADPAAVLTLTVEDDGPGCDPEQLAALTRRGARLDEADSGHGLGLAIVSEIVRQYHGELQLDRSPELGGLRATVRLDGH